MEQAVEKKKGIKKIINRKEECKKLRSAMKVADGTVIERITERCAEFDQVLYSITGTEAININPNITENVAQMLESEIKKALTQMRNEKAPGEDGMVVELLKPGEEQTNKKLKEILNLAQDKEAIPEKCKNYIIIYKIQLFMAFVDYEKAFDLIGHGAVMKALQR